MIQSVKTPDLYDLLDCNLDNIDLVKMVGRDKIKQEFQKYDEVINTEINYTSANSLSRWYSDNIIYPDTPGNMDMILNLIKRHNPRAVLEAGAGAGRLSKMVYDVLDGNVELFCVENNKVHYEQLIENFNTLQYEPKRIIKAETFHGPIHKLSQFENGKFDFVYTHTVLMHIPYTHAVMSAMELARVSSKYVCHVENKNEKDCIYPKHNAPGAPAEFNRLKIDYEKLYKKMGFATDYYEEVGEGKNTYLCYLGKRI